MKISRILATKPERIITITENETIRSAVARLAEHKIGALIVIDEKGALCGILSERDIVRQAVDDEALFSQPVNKVMTQNVVVGVPQDDVMAVANVMTESSFRHLPIVDDNRQLIGMISIGDVLKAQRDEYRGEIDTLEMQIMSKPE
jgi:CBS domain-containing protein